MYACKEYGNVFSHLPSLHPVTFRFRKTIKQLGRRREEDEETGRGVHSQVMKMLDNIVLQRGGSGTLPIQAV